MKQLFYAVAAIIVLLLAIRLMSKVKDFPEKKTEQFEDEDGVANDEGDEEEEDDEDDEEEDEDEQNVTS